MTLDIKVDISRCKSVAVGAEHGIAPAELREIAPRVEAAHEILAQERRDGDYGFYDLYKAADVFDDVENAADAFLAKGYDNLVILGIGGSALGTTALVTALKPPFYNTLTKRSRGGHPRIFVMDNIDPVSFRQMMRVCQPKKTLYNVISKSGSTAETVTQLLIVVGAIEKKLGKDAVKDHLVVTTNPRGEAKSLLHPVTDHYGLTEFAVPLNVGGRFSVFSPVGMFPAAMLGMDIEGMRAGCEAMDRRCSTPSLMENPAYLRAAVQYLADTRKGKVMSVMMPYSDALRDAADWYRQLWAESLGKRVSLDGEEVYAGQTPIKALGVTDQHSQVQLYREGPNNKLFNIIEVRRFEKTLRIPQALESIPEFDYLRGASMNKLMAAEVRATMDALKESVRPVSRVVLPRVNAHTVAQLLYMLEVETAMAGRLYNVQTFNQPGVEEGKRIARALMAPKSE
ncbi:MAG: glucose-6-phosphate isomerase [Nitrospiraceae bacterium]|nr:glucose-6-phosphate isomerase [Nitrospiraceae bacterium]